MAFPSIPAKENRELAERYDEDAERHIDTAKEYSADDE